MDDGVLLDQLLSLWETATEKILGSLVQTVSFVQGKAVCCFTFSKTGRNKTIVKTCKLSEEVA